MKRTTAILLALLAVLHDRWGGYGALIWILVGLSGLSVLFMLTAWRRRAIAQMFTTDKRRYTFEKG